MYTKPTKVEFYNKNGEKVAFKAIQTSDRKARANKEHGFKKGHKHSDEIKIKISKKLKGRKGVWLGKHLSEEHKSVLRAHAIKRIGDKSGNWKGGKSFEPYSVDWNGTLKRAIRERDKYICQLCGEPQGEEALCVHHIDYNKVNCNPTNLISLCRKCHTKTNGNRDYWTNYFTTR